MCLPVVTTMRLSLYEKGSSVSAVRDGRRKALHELQLDDGNTCGLIKGLRRERNTKYRYVIFASLERNLIYLDRIL